FHDQKPVRNQAAEHHAHLLPTGVGGLRKLTLELLEREGLQVVELLKNICDRRRGVRIDAEFLTLVRGDIINRFLSESRLRSGYRSQTQTDNKNVSCGQRAFHR